MGKRFILISILLIVLVNVAIYGKAVNYDFAGYDDPVYINNNPFIKDFNSDALRSIFTGFYFGNYQPLVHLSYAIDYAFTGLNAKSYHISNILFHLLNTVLVFLLVFTLTKERWPALIVAIIFSIHPMQVESVVWVSERKGLMCTFFSLLSLFSYIRYVKCAEKKYYALSFLLLLFALLSKPMAVTLPLIFLLYDYFVEKTARPKIIEKIPFFVLVAIFSVVTIYAQQSYGSIVTAWLPSILKNITFAFYTVGFYISKLVMPIKLSVHYAYPVTLGFLVKETIIAIIVLISIIAFIVKHKKINGIVNFGILFFLVSLIPVVRLVPIGDTFATDRYMYITMLGFFLAVVMSLYSLIKDKPTAKTVLAVITVLYMSYLGTASYARAKLWEDDIKLWEDAINNYPDSGTAYYNAGIACFFKYKFAQAEHYFKIAAKKRDNPLSIHFTNNYLTYNFLGESQIELNKISQAEQSFLKAIEFNKTVKLPHFNLGTIYKKRNDYIRALEKFNHVIELDPEFEFAYINIGEIRFSLGEYDKAITNFKKAVELAPENSDAYNGMGAAYGVIGNYEEALNCFNMALKYNPDDIIAKNNILNTKKLMINK